MHPLVRKLAWFSFVTALSAAPQQLLLCASASSRAAHLTLSATVPLSFLRAGISSARSPPCRSVPGRPRDLPASHRRQRASGAASGPDGRSVCGVARQDSELDATHLRKLKVADLRDALTARSLDASGTKPVMTDRLLEWKASLDAKSTSPPPAATEASAVTAEATMADVEKHEETSAAAAVAPAPVAPPQTAATPAPAPAAIAAAPAAAPAAAAPAAAAPAAAPPAEPSPAPAPAAPSAEPVRRTIKLTRKPPPTAEEEQLAKRPKIAETAAAIPTDAEALEKLVASLPAPIDTPTSAAAAAATTPSTTPRAIPAALRRRTSENASESSSSVRVDGFKRPITVAQIESLLKGFGSVKSISIPFVKNQALATFDSAEVAAAAVAKLHGMTGYPDASHEEVLSARAVPDKEVEDAANRSKAIVGAVRAPTQAAAPVRPDPRAAALRAAEETHRRREIELREQQQVKPAAVASRDEDMEQSSPAVVTISTGRRVITIKKRDDRDGGSHSGSGLDGPAGFRIEKRYDEIEEDAPMEVDDEPPTLELDQLFTRTAFKPALYWIAAEPKVQRRAAEERRTGRDSRSRSRSRGRR
jgi:hypothetical protein